MYEKVIAYCEKKHISVRGFEESCGLGNGTVARWKKYNPKLETLRKIAEATKTSLRSWL